MIRKPSPLCGGGLGWGAIESRHQQDFRRDESIPVSRDGRYLDQASEGGSDGRSSENPGRSGGRRHDDRALVRREGDRGHGRGRTGGPRDEEEGRGGTAPRLGPRTGGGGRRAAAGS